MNDKPKRKAQELAFELKRQAAFLSGSNAVNLIASADELERLDSLNTELLDALEFLNEKMIIAPNGAGIIGLKPVRLIRESVNKVRGEKS